MRSIPRAGRAAVSIAIPLTLLLAGCGSTEDTAAGEDTMMVLPSADIPDVPIPADGGAVVPTENPADGAGGLLPLTPSAAAIPSGMPTANGDVSAVSGDVQVDTDPSGVTRYTWGPVTVFQSGMDAPVTKVDGVKDLPAGLSKRTLSAGTAGTSKISAASNSILLLNYTATSAGTGQELTSTWAKGAAATVRSTELPTGWASGMDGMAEGERRLLVMPSDMTVSSNGKTLVKATPGDTVVIVVDLMDVVDLPAAPASPTAAAPAPSQAPAPTLAPAPVASPSLVPAPTPSPSATATPTPSPSPTVRAFVPVPETMFGLHVPWALPTNYSQDGQEYTQWTGDWPNVFFSSLRLWDTRTTWALTEPQDGEYSWAMLDAQVAQAKQNNIKDFVMVLAGTPEWAISGPAEGSAAWIGPNSASPPVSDAVWVDFVTQVVTRYKGTVRNYEIWNEPNSSLFWQGTPEQMARLVYLANKTIKKIDPKAKVIAPAPAISEKMPPKSAKRWWAALADRGWPVDVVAVHLYPSPEEGVPGFVDDARETEKILDGLSWDGPVWVTEASYVSREGQEPPTAQESRELVAKTYWAARDLGYERVYWYAWAPTSTGDGPNQMLLLQRGTDAAAGYDDAYQAGRQS